MKKFLKDLGVLLLFTMTIFSIVYMMIWSWDKEYEVMLEQEKAYFERIEEMRR